MSDVVVRVCLIGTCEVAVGADVVPPAAFGGGLARRLLRVLATTQGRPASRAALAEALWPGRRPADVDGNLAVQVSRIRRATTAAAVVTTPTGYALADPPRVLVDVHECARWVAEGRAAALRGDVAAARSAYRRVIDTSGGGVLPEDDGAWAEVARVEVERCRREALRGAAGLAAHPAEAVELAAEAVAGAPLDEGAHLLLVDALARTGDRPGALAAWDRMRVALRDELGLDPSAEAHALQAAVLDDRIRPAAVADVQPVRPPLVDRDEELAVLRHLTAGPPTRVGVVIGSAGSGKSRLLSEATAALHRPVLALRATLAERAEPWALARQLIAEVLRRAPASEQALGATARAAVADLLPDAGGAADTPPAPGRLSGHSLHAARREACVRLVGAVPGAVLVVDDLQWADATSADVLARAADRRTAAAVLMALRPEEVGPGSPAARLLDHLDAAHRPHRLVLPPLSPAAVAALAGDPDLAGVLVAHTDRTPFAVLEVLDTLALEQPAAAGSAPRPRGSAATSRAAAIARQGRTAALAARARARPPAQRTVLGLLALLAREATVDLLAGAAAMPVEAVLAALDGLHRAGLVRAARRGWAPAHDLVGEAVGADLDDVERIRLHRALSAALADRAADRAEVGHHLELAGDPDGAVPAYAAAVAERVDRHAHREAAELADRALALDPADGADRWSLLLHRGEVRHHLGDLAGSRADLRDALAAAATPSQRCRVLAASAMAASGAEDIGHARELAELAVVAAGARPPDRARALAVASIIDVNTGRPEQARARADEALELYRALGDTAGVADILDGRAMAVFMEGRITDAVAAFDRVAGLFADAGDLLRVVTPRSTGGHGLVFAGRAAAGLPLIEAAADLADQLGNREGASYTAWHRAEALAALGRTDEALASAAAALGAAQRIGHRGWTATGHLATGIARHASGDVAGAVAAYETCLAASTLDLFTAWASGRLALALLDAGRPEAAAPHIDVGLATGPPLGRFPARQARAQLAAARGADDVAELAAAVLAEHEAAGWGLWSDRLRALTGG